MTEKLKPCPDDAYVVSVLESMRDSPEAFSRHAISGIADRLLTAWNTRATGWRPIEEAPKDEVVWGWGSYGELYPPEAQRVHYWDIMERWVDGEGYQFNATHFMLITPPDSEAPHD